VQRLRRSPPTANQVDAPPVDELVLNVGVPACSLSGCRFCACDSLPKRGGRKRGLEPVSPDSQVESLQVYRLQVCVNLTLVCEESPAELHRMLGKCEACWLPGQHKCFFEREVSWWNNSDTQVGCGESPKAVAEVQWIYLGTTGSLETEIGSVDATTASKQLDFGIGQW